MIRILWRTENSERLILGPLGCYERGQKLEIDGDRYTVTSIDPDGAGVAFSAAHLRERYDKEVERNPDLTPEQFLQGDVSRVRTSYSSGWSGERSEAGMTAQIARNRREHGLDPEVDPR